MKNLPEYGALVRFRIAPHAHVEERVDDGAVARLDPKAPQRLVPKVSGTGFYDPKQVHEERFTERHYALLLDGSIQLEAEPTKPAEAEPAKPAEPAHG